jgi:polygalacturonase
MLTFLVASSLPFAATCRVADVNAADLKADEQADDTAALQAALTKAGETGGGVVQLPVGQIRIDGNLVVRPE